MRSTPRWSRTRWVRGPWQRVIKEQEVGTHPERVRMYFIGCGNMGRNHLRDILKQQDTTEIVALCDIAPERPRKLPRSSTRQACRSPSEPSPIALANHALDAVFIVTHTRFTSIRPGPIWRRG